MHASPTIADLGSDPQNTLDPRPDLVEDTALWADLLALAYALDEGRKDGTLYGALDVLRCEGCGLRVGRRTLQLLAGEIEAADYADWRRRWLEPHRAALTTMLHDLAGAVSAQRLVKAA